MLPYPMSHETGAPARFSCMGTPGLVRPLLETTRLSPECRAAGFVKAERRAVDGARDGCFYFNTQPPWAGHQHHCGQHAI